MTEDTQSTIVQLLYRTTPELDFRGIVGDLERALVACLPAGRGMVWDHDDLAMVDLPGGRIVLAWAADLRGPHRACLTVSIGAGAEPERQGAGLARRQTGLVRMVAERIGQRHPADSTCWHRHAGPVSAELIDTLTEAAAILPLDLGLGTQGPATAPMITLDGLVARIVAVETRAKAPGPAKAPVKAVPPASAALRLGARSRRVGALIEKARADLPARITPALAAMRSLPGRPARVSAAFGALAGLAVVIRSGAVSAGF